MNFKRAMAVLAGLAMAIPAQTPAGGSDDNRPIHQEIDYKASPQRIYKALLDSKQFGAITGLPAVIQPVAGGTFSCFGGEIVGRNIELIPNRRIIQAWQAKGWGEGVYSVVRFELKAQGTGTRLILDHTGFPSGEREHLDPGWPLMYWDPLRKFLGE